VLVENHKGVLEYGETVMRISCGKMVIRIEGVGLELDAMSLDAVAVTGKIKSVTYDG
jgi:sporulation protein YqfC